MRGLCRSLGFQLSSRTSKFRTWLVFLEFSCSRRVCDKQPKMANSVNLNLVDNFGQPMHHLYWSRWALVMSSFQLGWRALSWHTLRSLIIFLMAWVLRQDQFCKIFFQFSSYEPELFPGLIYRCSFELFWKLPTLISRTKSSSYFISLGWWSRALSSSFLFPAKSSWLGQRYHFFLALVI